MFPGTGGSPGMGLGYAAVLVQLHLGIGLVLLVLAAAASSAPALRGAPWAAGLRAAAAAAGPAPLLAVFALIQASAAPPDLLAWAGLLASTGAVVLGPLHVLLCGGFGLELPAVDAGSGDIVGPPAGGERPGLARCLSALARALGSLRALGHALLLLASPPAGAQLLCASVLLRVALGAHALGAAASALAPRAHGGALAGLLRDAGKAAAAAPLVGSLALLDAAAFGPSPLLLAPLHPALYCAVAVLAQAGLALAVRTSLGGSVEASERAELDFHFKLDEDKSHGEVGAHVERARRLFVACLHAAMALGVARVLAGSISIEASASGFSLQWGEPLFATASLLAALLIATHVIDYSIARAGGPDTLSPGEAPTNGCSEAPTNGCSAPAPAAAGAAPEAPGAMSQVKAAVLPAQSLVLALLVVHLQALESADTGAPSSAAALAALPFRYGLVLAAAAVAAQAALAALEGAGSPGRLQQAADLCLRGGLLMGWAGMGVQLWAVLALTVGPCAYLVLPTEARETLRSIVGAVGGSVTETVECLSSCMEAYVKQRQYEKEVLHARRADEMAAEVEKELGKAPKGLKAKVAAPAEVKVSKAKSASKTRRR